MYIAGQYCDIVRGICYELWTMIYCRHWPPSAPVCIWEDTCRSMHTQQLLLLVLVCGTPCHHYLWQDMNYRHFKQSLKGHMFRLQWPWRIVSVFVHFRRSLTYLLTTPYLLMFILWNWQKSAKSFFLIKPDLVVLLHMYFLFQFPI